MTHITCPTCELRFGPAVAASLTSCPFCGGGLATAAALGTVGFQLIDRVVPLTELPEARSAALPHPRPLGV